MNTIENALYALPLVQETEAKECVVVTNDFHIARTKRIFDMVFQNTGIAVKTFAAEDIVVPGSSATAKGNFPTLLERLGSYGVDEARKHAPGLRQHHAQLPDFRVSRRARFAQEPGGPPGLPHRVRLVLLLWEALEKLLQETQEEQKLCNRLPSPHAKGLRQ